MRSLPLVLIMLLAVGCGREAPTATSPTTDPSTSGGELTVAVIGDANRLDPHTVTDAASMRIIECLYSTLLRYDEAYGEFANDLAADVAVSDDHRTYTITLVDDAVFHSGRPVTSDAVKFSIERIIDKGVRAQHFEAVQTIDTPDEQTVVITLAHPVAPFRSYLAYPMNAIVDPRAVAEADDSLDATVAGSGPFVLVDHQRDRHIIMDRHEGYHVDDQPGVDRLIVRPIADETARTTALRTGEIDVIHEVAPQAARSLENAAGVVVASVPGTFWEYIGLNCDAAPFDDVRVRQAIAHAVDRAQLNQLVKRGGATELVGGHISPGHWAHGDLTIYPQPDHATASQLLADAGHGDGFEVELIVDGSVVYQVRAAEVIKQQLLPLGIDVHIQALESGVFFERLGRGDFQMTLVGWMGFVDPDEWTWNLFHSQGQYNQQNYTNERVDALLDEGRTTLDRPRRIEIYTEAQRLIAEDAPMVFLYVNDHTSAWRDHVRNFQPHPTATLRHIAQTRIAD